jgi:hypothetical protein
LVERLREQLAEEVNGHALVPQLLYEGVVLLSRALDPHNVVEQQLVDVARRKPHHLQTGTMHYDLLEDADLGVNVECHVHLILVVGTSFMQHRSRRRCPRTVGPAERDAEESLGRRR